MESSDLPEMRTSGIYKIVSPTSRVYIGSSVCIRKRWLNYIRGNCHKQPRLYASILKYGGDAHKYEIIELCSIDNLTERERFWQDHFDVLSKKGLNCVLVAAENSPTKVSRSTSKKISRAHKGRIISMETRQKLRDRYIDQVNPNIGRKCSLKHKQLMSKYHSGEGNPMYGKSGELNPFFGKTHSWETKMKRCLIVVNLESGIFHYGVPDAADTYNYNRGTLRNWLQGRAKNKSNLRIC